MMEVRLYVGNLAYSTTEEELHVLFAQAGKVTSVDLIQDQDKGKPKGYAYVTLSTEIEAQQAITQFDAFSLAGRALKVSLAKPSAAPAGHQGQFSAPALGGREPAKGKPGQPRATPGAYQSRLSAFGSGSSPVPPGRRGRSQRR
jgi:RNA recognition motif-containing protein